LAVYAKKLVRAFGEALTEAMDEGHCGLPTAELIPQ
jgi:hypothetical protein